MERFVLTNIKGVDTTSDPRTLEDNVLAKFVNGYLQKDGAVSRIVLRGGLKPDTNNLLSQSTNTLLRGWMIKDDAGNYRRFFATTNGVYYVDNNTINNLYTENLYQIGGVIRYDDKMILVDAYEPKVVRDLFTTPTVSTLILETPDISGVTITSGTPANNTVRAYVMTYFTADGVESPPSVRFGTAIEPAGTLTFNNLPVPNDPKIVGKRLYRALGSVFYKLVDLAVTETTFTDTISDDDLDRSMTPNYLVNLQTAKYGLLHKNRLFLANISYKDINPYQLLYMPSFTLSPINVTENDPPSIPTTDRVGVIPAPDIKVYNFNTGNPQLDRRTVYLPYMDVTVNMANGSGIQAYPDGRTIEYKIYLRTADNRYSDVVLSTQVTVTNFDAVNRDDFEVKLKNLWTAFFGADRYQPFPEHTYIEVYATSLNYANKYRRVATKLYNPSIFDGGQNDVIDNGGAEADNLDLPTVNVPLDYLYPSGVVYSDPEQLGLLLYGNKFIVESEVGGAIRGLAETTDGVWIIKEKAIYKIFTESLPASWRLYKVADIGSTYWNGLVARKGIVAFIYLDSIYLLTDEGLKEIGYPIRNWLGYYLASNSIPEGGLITDKYIVFKLRNTVTNASNLFIYDITLNVWYIWSDGMLSGGTFRSSVLYENINGKNISQIGLLLEIENLAYRFYSFDDASTTDDGVIYNMEIKTKVLDAGTDLIRPVSVKLRGDSITNINTYLNDSLISLKPLPSVTKIPNNFVYKFTNAVQLTLYGQITNLDTLSFEYLIRKGL